MESPEILLKDLNHALRRLRGACAELGNEEIDEELLAIMRRLLLAEVLGNTWIIAMGGSQGAGKTTLMASLYDLHNDDAGWLRSNEGRGEKMPVLILEDPDVNKPQGYVRRLIQDSALNGFRLCDIDVDISEFQRAVSDPETGDLLPVLRVPVRYFKRKNQAWLLLPGYEKQVRANREWQELMRQAMIAAGGTIIVTDETRMANQQQLDIVRDMLENELKHCKPCIVITKTEAYRDDEIRQRELIKSAQTTFGVADDVAHKNIILTGTDDLEFRAQWMPRLQRAVDDLNFTGQSDRHRQISHLSEIVSKDLTRVLNAIRSKSRLYFNADRNGAGDGAQVLEEILEAFDSAAEELRTQYSEKVKIRANEARSAASEIMDTRLRDEHEGFINWMSNAFDTTSETRGKLQQLVRLSWQEVVPVFQAKYANDLSQLTAKALDRAAEGKFEGKITHGLAPDKHDLLVRLGYLHTSGHLVRYKNLTPQRTREIKMLLGYSSQNGPQDSSEELSKSVALIPAFTLEYARLIYALPEVQDELGHCFADEEHESVDVANAAVAGVASLQAGVDLGKTALRSVAAVLAVDVVSDGDSDILGALFGKSTDTSEEETTSSSVPVPMIMHPVAIAATAVVAAAYVTTSALTRIRTFEKQASVQAHTMLTSVRDHHVEHLLRQFDQMMNMARARIVGTLRTRYRMDDMLMRKDRLAKAIADVKVITSDLRYELDSSPAGLQVLASSNGH